ncbi:MAG: hypothetical protein LUC30_07605 [Clostridiales bacterium]|nr:hypothetical protein [Clostridiales bacterium]
MDYAQKISENRIGCISTAFRAFLRVGPDIYTEALHILIEAWGGERHFLRGETVRAIIEFVDLYHGEYSRDRLVSKLQMVDPLTILRKGQAMGVNMAGYKKYLYQVFVIYNGTSRKTALPLNSNVPMQYKVAFMWQ